MAKTKKKEEDQDVSLLENPDALASRAEEFFNKKQNQNILYGVLTAIILIVGGFTFYKYQQSTLNEEAQQEMFQAIYYFEADSLGSALNGDGNNYGFLDIMDEYSGTEAANIASYYAGACYLKLGDYENAIRNFDNFSSSDYLVQARAYSLVGDCYMELDQFADAVTYFEKAASYKPNKEFTPIYLKKLAVAEEQRGNFEEAAEAYEKINEDFQGSRLQQEAEKQAARLKGLSLN